MQGDDVRSASLRVALELAAVNLAIGVGADNVLLVASLSGFLANLSRELSVGWRTKGKGGQQSASWRDREFAKALETVGEPGFGHIQVGRELEA